MKNLKLILKIFTCLVGILFIIVIVLLNSESYETITKENRNEIVHVEIKKVFGKKISECSINSEGLYHGPSKSWRLLSDKVKSEGYFKNGYWHGKWKDYDNDGQLIMVREWIEGKLNKVFTPVGEILKEVPKDQWPKYVDVKQNKPQRVNG